MDLHNDFSISLLTWLRWLDGHYKYWIQAVNQTDALRQDFAGRLMEYGGRGESQIVSSSD